MKLRTEKKRRTRFWSWVRKFNRRMKGRHDLHVLVARWNANPWEGAAAWADNASFYRWMLGKETAELWMATPKRSTP